MMDYYEYIRSPRWRAKAKRWKDERGRKCQVCGERGVQLDAHHNTYERLGRELDTDIVILCRECHTLFHDQTAIESTDTSSATQTRIGWSCYEDRADLAVMAVGFGLYFPQSTVHHLHHYKGTLIVYCSNIPWREERRYLGARWAQHPCRGGLAEYRHAVYDADCFNPDNISAHPLLLQEKVP